MGAHAPVALAAAAVVALALPACGFALPSSQAGATGTAPVTERYLVVLEDSATSPVVVAGQQVGFGAAVADSQVFSHALDGYTADLTPADAQRLRADDRVAAVEPDQVLHLAQVGQDVPSGVQRIFGAANVAADIDGVDDARVDVDVAVIDSGIDQHPDLGVASGADCTGGLGCVGGQADDDYGHGTHVAGTIGAIDNDIGVVGVAPGARLHALKACTGSGQCLLSAIIAALDQVAAQANVIEVANMSFAGPGSSTALDRALAGAVDAGVVLVAAAGNEAHDAAGYFPGYHDDVISVSALADTDGVPGGSGGRAVCRPQSYDELLADFSNYGPAVEIAAPGVCILSTSAGGTYATMSGTSMASPHVAGAAALLTRGAADPTTREAVLAVRQRLVETGNLAWIDTSGDGVKEPLLDLTSIG